MYQASLAFGGPGSARGLPVTEEYALTGGRESDFQHGSITFDSATGLTSVTLHGTEVGCFMPLGSAIAAFLPPGCALAAHGERYKRATDVGRTPRLRESSTQGSDRSSPYLVPA